MPVTDLIDCGLGTVQKCSVIKQMRCQKSFEIGRRAAVKMDAGLVEAKAYGWLGETRAG